MVLRVPAYALSERRTVTFLLRVNKPAPWPLGPSSTAFLQMFYALYSESCRHLWLERHWRQSLTSERRRNSLACRVCDLIRFYPSRKASSSHPNWRNKENDRWDKPRGPIPAIWTEPSSPSRIFPAFRSLQNTQEHRSDSPLRLGENQVNPKVSRLCSKAKHFFLLPF